jgi:hypothetical protein
MDHFLVPKMLTGTRDSRLITRLSHSQNGWTTAEEKD